MAKISRQKFSSMGYYEEDFQKDRKWRYDLTVARNARTQTPIVIQENIRQHSCTILGQEYGKKKNVLLTSIASDLEQKVCNDEARETALRKLIKKGRADYNIPNHAEGEKIVFRDSDVIPRPGCQKEYQEILDRYPSCCVILVSPDESLCDEAARLAVSVGISPKYIDSDLKYDSKRYTEFGHFTAVLSSESRPGCFISDKKRINLADSFRTGDVIIVNSGTQHGQTAESTTGCVFQQMVRQAMFDRHIVAGSSPIPVIEYVDSLQTMGVDDWLEPMFALGRKFGFCMVYAIETTSLLDDTSLGMGLQHLLLRGGTVICLDREAVEELAIELPALAQATSKNMIPDGNKIFLLTKNKPPFIDFQLGICSRQLSGK